MILTRQGWRFPPSFLPNFAFYTHHEVQTNDAILAYKAITKLDFTSYAVQNRTPQKQGPLPIGGRAKLPGPVLYELMDQTRYDLFYRQSPEMNLATDSI